MANVTVVGLGYVGLPLACLAVKKGHSVTGFDINPAVSAAVLEGKSPLRDKTLEREVAEVKGKLKCTTDPERAFSNAEVVLVCVPTPVTKDKQPDLSPLLGAVDTLAPRIAPGTLVVIESTIYPGVIEEVLLPVLAKSGKHPGTDFLLAHCPERVDPSNPHWNVANIPRVLGGYDAESTRQAVAFYRSLLEAEIHPMRSIRVAEAVKITENTYRDINIAFVNELAQSFDRLGIDVTEVIKGAATKPFGYTPFYPGPGVGGHCIPVDPYYLIEKARKEGFQHRFLSLAREVNEGMPEYVVACTEQSLQAVSRTLSGSTVAVLGIAYKKEVDDPRESPSLAILSILASRGCRVRSYDPFLPQDSTSPSLQAALDQADAVILATDHDSLVKDLTPDRLKKAGITVLVDARNALERKPFIAAGILYKGIGR